MLTEDYIMRMINQVLAVFLQALGLKKAGLLDEALQVFDQALEILLGIRPNLVKQLEDRQLLALLTFQNKLDVDRLLVLADIYREEGEVYALLRQPEQVLFAAQRSLRLYLEACLATETNPTPELAQKIETQRSRLSASDLAVETRLALMDYFDRLLASGEDCLTAIGLSRPYIQATLASLDNADLH
jgi:tetratricopeptide (TPR) repeat protein